MTTNTRPHCPTCISVARDTVLEGIVENIMDDENIDFDTAVKRVVPADLDAAVIEYLDGILKDQDNSLTTRPNTCVFIHNDWY